MTNRRTRQMLMSAILPFHRPVMDSMMAMTLGGLFNRFPNLQGRAAIEVGAAWVGYCLHELDHAGPTWSSDASPTFDGELVGRPSEVFRQHCYVAPFPEEDVVTLGRADRRRPGAVRLRLAAPRGSGSAGCFRKFVVDLPDESSRMIMRDNALGLVQPG